MLYWLTEDKIQKQGKEGDFYGNDGKTGCQHFG